MVSEAFPTTELVLIQLKRIMESSQFKAPAKQRKFLKFIVDETLAGNLSQLKGYTIGVMVYKRPESFDPQTDPIVRVEAGRLRRNLDYYYFTAGMNDPLRISIPKGGYVPVFHPSESSTDGIKKSIPEHEEDGLITTQSIAVMPFLNIERKKEQDYFVEGLTEELTMELVRYQDFRVIAAQSTMQLKEEKNNYKKIGRALKVRFLVEGSVRKYAKTIKVSVKLIDTLTADHLWGQSYKISQKAYHLIDVQENIAKSVMGIIADQFGVINRSLSMESRKKAPRNMLAYDAILQFYHYETVLTLQSFEAAMKALKNAVSLEPDYALAWAMIGHLHADNYALGFCEIENPLDKALAYSQKAIALDPLNQFAQDALSLVYFHKGDKISFLKQVEQTICLNSNSPYIVGVAGWHMILFGEWDRGRDLLKKGMDLNPFYPSWFHLATYVDFYRRCEYENALAEALKFNFPKLFIDPMIRAAALGKLGKQKEAKKAIGQLIEMVPDFGHKAKQLIGRYIKVNNVINSIVDGLQNAGLNITKNK